MTAITRNIEVNTSKDKVWGLLADAGAISQWFAPVAGAEVSGQGLGSTRTCNLGEMGKLEEEFVEWQEGTKIGYTVRGAFPGKNALATWTLADRGARTAIDYVLTYDGLVDPAANEAAVEQELSGLVDFVLASFKAFAETGTMLQPPATA